MVLGEEQKLLGTAAAAVQRHHNHHNQHRVHEQSTPRGPGMSVSEEGGAGAATARTGMVGEKVGGKEKGQEESG